MPAKKTAKIITRTKTASRKTTAKRKTTRKSTKTAAKKRVTSTSDEITPVATEDTRCANPVLPIEIDLPVPPDIDEIASEISCIDQTESARQTDEITPIFPDGDFNISRKVLARIASLAAGEIDGFVPPRRNPIRRIMDSIQGRTDGIRVYIGTTEAAVDMLVRVRYGTRIPKLTSLLRDKIATRIHEMTGLNVIEINVRVMDVTPPGQSTQSG